MKTNIHRSALAAALTIGCAAVQQANGQVTQSVAISGIEILQGTTLDNSITTKTKSPTRFGFTTRTLEQNLASDETSGGRWFADSPNKFPAKARLEAIFPNAGDFSSVSFSVVEGTNVIDVSNLLTAGPADGNAVVAGAFTDAGGATQPPFADVSYNEYTLAYDATPVGGVTKWAVNGQATLSTTTTKPNGKGVFVETDTFTLASGSGDGIDNNTNSFELTGFTVAAAGRASINPGAAPAVSKQ